MRFKIKTLWVTVVIILFSMMLITSQTQAVNNKGTAYVFMGNAVQTRLTPGWSIEKFKTTFPSSFVVTFPSGEIGIGYAPAISLPILSHLRFHVSGSYHLEKPKIIGGTVSIYYDWGKLFNVTPYVGAEVGYLIKYMFDINFSDVYLPSYVQSTVLFTGGVKFNLPKTPLALFAEFSYGIHGDVHAFFTPKFYYEYYDQYNKFYITDKPYFDAVSYRIKRYPYKGLYSKARAGILLHFY